MVVAGIDGSKEWKELIQGSSPVLIIRVAYLLARIMKKRNWCRWENTKRIGIEASKRLKTLG